MSTQRHPACADNLRRWQESGQPRAWVASRSGQWDHADWLTLLANLRHSEFWPLDPADVGLLLERLRQERDNLLRWTASDWPRQWVAARGGKWDQADWLGLLESLREAGLCPIQPDAVLRVLEGLKTEWHNLRRWEQSGQPRRWVESRDGEWAQADWWALVRTLQQSEFWPLDLSEAAELVESLKARSLNLRAWVAAGWPRRWVEAQRGRWRHADWLALLESLRRSSYWPLDLDAVGRVLEETQRRYLNLRRWERSGQARAWVEARQGQWGHDDWLALLEDLRRSEFWPLEPDAVGEVLGEIREEWRALRRWHESGQALKWVEARQGRWGREDLKALLDGLRQSEVGPLNPEATERVLRQVTAEWWNLRRWRDSGQPWLWVKARAGQWGHEDLLALLEDLRQSQFWPLDRGAVGEVLEQVQREYGNLRRWRESGQLRRWVEGRQGQWTHEDLRALLDGLRQSEFWPLDPAMAEVELEAVRWECANLRCWRESGAARQWVEARQGRWGHDDWLALLRGLQGSAFWPLEPASLGRVLEEARAEWLVSLRQARSWPSGGEALRQLTEDPHPPARQAA
jgi:hypothetical protein